MLDNADIENGCLQAIKGSHKLGYLDHNVDGYFVGACQEPNYWSDPSKIVNLTMKAGDISIHHCLTLHGSPENTSGQFRRMLVFQYRAADAYQLGGDIQLDNGLIVRGSYQGIVRCESGCFSLPKRVEYGYKQPYGTAWNQMGGYGRGANIQHGFDV